MPDVTWVNSNTPRGARELYPAPLSESYRHPSSPVVDPPAGYIEISQTTTRHFIKSAACGPMDLTESSTASSFHLSSFQSSDRDYSTSSYSQRPRSDRSSMSEAESMLIDVDAARYSLRWKMWRRTSKSTRMATEVPLPSSFRIVTWNVDFNTPNAKARLKTALQHIQGDVLKCKGGERPPPCCILLQEILRVREISCNCFF